MALASLRGDEENLGQLAPKRKTHGTVCAFARHRREYANAVAELGTLAMRGSARLLMMTLLADADPEGLYWGQVRGELRALTGLSVNRLLEAARELRKLGLLSWVWIRPFSRFPLRVSRSEPAKWGRGNWTQHGGRVWVVHWEKLGVAFARRTMARKEQGSITDDRSGSITDDRSTDPLGSPSEILKMDPAPAEDVERRAAPPPPDRAREDRGDRAVASLPPLPVKAEKSVQGVRAPRGRPHVPPERMPAWLQAGARMGEAAPERPKGSDGPPPED
jgi:hypothetical protein